MINNSDKSGEFWALTPEEQAAAEDDPAAPFRAEDERARARRERAIVRAVRDQLELLRRGVLGDAGSYRVGVDVASYLLAGAGPSPPLPLPPDCAPSFPLPVPEHSLERAVTLLRAHARERSEILSSVLGPVKRKHFRRVPGGKLELCEQSAWGAARVNTGVVLFVRLL